MSCVPLVRCNDRADTINRSGPKLGAKGGFVGKGRYSRQCHAAARRTFSPWWPDRPISSRALTKVVRNPYIKSREKPEDRQMWPYLQMWFPLFTVTLGIAICFGVASFVMSQGKARP